ncbi:MAG: hypothetical protein HZB26_12820 [Candidatus Hydrogenedentes bacterium]|nr:hypothetical protein [Candidatus Hydrogenedentota bacterium]
MTLGTKLIGGFTTVSILTAIAGSAAFWGVTKLSKQAQVLEDGLRAAAMAIEIR